MGNLEHEIKEHGNRFWPLRQQREGRLTPSDILTDEDGFNYTVKRAYVKDGTLFVRLRPHCETFPEPFWLEFPLNRRRTIEVPLTYGANDFFGGAP